MGAREQIENMSVFERNSEAFAAETVAKALADLERALELARKSVLSDEGDDAIAGMIDGIGDSGIHGWLQNCQDAGVLSITSRHGMNEMQEAA